MAKRLFNDDERFNAAGQTVDMELSTALLPIFEKWTALGYSIRDLTCIASLATVEAATWTILRNKVKGAKS